MIRDLIELIRDWVTLIGILALVALSLVLGGGLVIYFIAFFFSDFEYSSGSRYGQIIKFSRVGIIFKTHEGELLLGGAESNSTASIWRFSVEKEKKQLQNRIQVAARKGQRVELIYSQRILVMPWVASSNYLLTDIKEQSQS